MANVFFVANPTGQFLTSAGEYNPDALYAAWFFSQDLATRVAESVGGSVVAYESSIVFKKKEQS